MPKARASSFHVQVRRLVSDSTNMKFLQQTRATKDEKKVLDDVKEKFALFSTLFFLSSAALDKLNTLLG